MKRMGGREPWRVPGGRKPADVVVIGRGTRWGNPHTAEEHGTCAACGGDRHTRDEAVALYRRHLREHPDLVTRARAELTGKTLWCPGCPPGVGPCHGDVLLAVAGGEDP
jgi:hypothetical protein